MRFGERRKSEFNFSSSITMKKHPKSIELLQRRGHYAVISLWKFSALKILAKITSFKNFHPFLLKSFIWLEEKAAIEIWTGAVKSAVNPKLSLNYSNLHKEKMQNYFILNFAFMVTFVLVYTRQVILRRLLEVVRYESYRTILTIILGHRLEWFK